MRTVVLMLTLGFGATAAASDTSPLGVAVPPATTPEVAPPADAQGRAVPEVGYRSARTRVEPRFLATKEARRLARQGPLHCALRVFLDRYGAPYEVRAEACPDALFPAAQKAVYQWRWDPVDDAPAQLVLRLAQYR